MLSRIAVHVRGTSSAFLGFARLCNLPELLHVITITRIILPQSMRGSLVLPSTNRACVRRQHLLNSVLLYLLACVSRSCKRLGFPSSHPVALQGTHCWVLCPSYHHPPYARSADPAPA